MRPRAERSFKYFHPDVDWHTFDIRDEGKILGEIKEPPVLYPTGAIRPRFMRYLLNKGYDTVIYLDVDTVTVGRCDELLAGDFDIAGSLNIPLPHDDKYLNAGVMAVRNKEFCDEWERGLYSLNSTKSNQPIYNGLAKKYGLKIVDERDVYYNERSRPYWKDIFIKDDKLYCNGRQLKVMHWAGGFHEEKISCAGFSDEVRKFLNSITGTTDFTDTKGKWRWF